jgi:hypothetical protein
MSREDSFTDMSKPAPSASTPSRDTLDDNGRQEANNMKTTKRDRPQQRSGIQRASGRDYDEWFTLLDQ